MTTQQQGDAVPEWTVGDRLRKAREVLDLDQTQFAALTGISRGTVSNYERGTTNAYKPVYMRAWAMATGISLEWLETGQGAPHSPTPPPSGERAGELAKLTEKKRRRAGGTSTRQYLVPAYAAA